MQLIDLTPVDTALEAIACLPPAGTPIIRSWSAADTALCISTIVGYVVTLTLAFLLHKRVNAVQESFNKCKSGVPRLFWHDKPDQEPKINLLLRARSLTNWKLRLHLHWSRWTPALSSGWSWPSKRITNFVKAITTLSKQLKKETRQTDNRKRVSQVTSHNDDFS